MESNCVDSTVMESSLIEDRFAKLLENNDTPSQFVAAEINGLLVKPLQKLNGVDQEIGDIKQTLDTLEAECEDLKGSISRYELLRAPIRRLPPDILHEIFYRCLPIHRNPIMNCEEAPLLLTCICQSWRSIALSSPRLWTRIHIPLYLPRNVKNNVPNAWGGFMQSEGERNKAEVEWEVAEKTIRSRKELVQTWLSRSGVLPLSISLSCEIFSDLLEENILRQIFSTILFFSPMIGDLQLSMPFDIYQVYLSDISPDSLPLLRKLRVGFSGRVSMYGDSSSAPPVSLMQAPNLQSLSIRAKAGHPARAIFTVAENLRDLSIHHCITSTDAIRILRRLNRLEHCKLFIASHPDESHFDPEDSISLPWLQSLNLAVSVITDGMSELYKQLHAPHLARLNYRRFVHRPHRHAAWSALFGTEESPSTLGLHYIVEQASKLTKLSLDSSRIEAQDILLCLRSASQVTHLTLGLHSREIKHPDEVGFNTGQYEFDLHHLTLPQEPVLENKDKQFDLTVGHHINSANLMETLLPKLEVFEGLRMAVKTTDSEVKRFILGRLGASAERNGVSSLKQVKMTFYRAQQMNVGAEIRRLVKEEGVAIELDMRYVVSRVAYSPWDGMLDNSQSWDIQYR
ncbi:hypothetical protein CPB84DRAFT_1771105 [Gymnopilus junonius]|uniref:F-box domain-containing protein n=1 Tax=Gymnopilus junonius TaxID=109634 RepID=A0A9P5TRH3_GYMJU|nr:hypothetical protein CPB84DRAFT_1771105 [Gymnopilus junonius]